MTTNPKTTAPAYRKRPRYYRDLSKPKQGLLRKFQNIGYGTVENLVFQDGDPVDRPAPKICRNIRLRGYGRKKKEEPPDDFELKDEHVELFMLLEDEGSGYIKQIKVADGLPAEVSMEETE